MSEIESEYERQADDAYRAIGIYVVEFSQMVFFMRATMSQRLMKPGDGVRLAELALGDASAYQIANSFFAMCSAVGGFDADEKKIAKALRGKVLKEIERRNDIAHGDWWVGVIVNERIVAPPRLIKTRAAKTEQTRVVLDVPVAELEAWSEALSELGMLVGEFGQLALGIYPMGQTVRVRDLFVLEGKKNEEKVVVRKEDG